MDIRFYEDHRGKRPVEKFIESLTQRSELNQVVAHIRALKVQGYRLQRPMAAFLRNGIYELRPGQNRILYGYDQGTVVLLHALRKKTREIPSTDIELAVRRLEGWRNR